MTKLFVKQSQIIKLDWTKKQFFWQDGLTNCQYCGLFDNQPTTEMDRLLHIFMDCTCYEDEIFYSDDD